MLITEKYAFIINNVRTNQNNAYKNNEHDLYFTNNLYE